VAGLIQASVAAHAVSLSGVKVHTFSLGIKEYANNESSYAKTVADILQTEHHEFLFSYRDIASFIGEMDQCFDEPFADTSAIPTMLLSKEAKRFITVALSGEGGDELFFGYGSYQWARRLKNPLFRKAGQWLSPLLEHGSSRHQRIAQLLRNANLNTAFLHDHIFSQEQYLFSRSELQELLPADKYNSFLSAHDIRALTIFDRLGVNGSRHLSSMEEQALFDIACYLPDDLLTKVDRASMRYAIETRVPYLDYRVVEFALNLSPTLKYRNGTSKYILRAILERYLPGKLFNRPSRDFPFRSISCCSMSFGFCWMNFLMKKCWIAMAS
jgi:asparagine synthase (glutamine-hydrolysing)